MKEYYKRILAEAVGALKATKSAMTIATDSVGDVAANDNDPELESAHDRLQNAEAIIIDVTKALEKVIAS